MRQYVKEISRPKKPLPLPYALQFMRQYVKIVIANYEQVYGKLSTEV